MVSLDNNDKREIIWALLDNHSKKREIISFLAENSASPYVRNVVDLCKILIDEARIANDEARGASFLLNQGEIRVLKKLVSSLTKKVPKEQKSQMVID